jgi:hypothetical protein
VARAAGSADPADDGEYEVLGGHAPRQRAVDLDQHAFLFLGDDRLGGQGMLDLRGADTECQAGEGAVGAGMRIAAYHRHARQGGTLLGTDHVDDALAAIVDVEIGDPVVVRVVVQRLHLQTRDGVRDALRAVGRRHVVVHDGKVGLHAPELAARLHQSLEGLRAGDFMQQVPVYIKQAGTVVVLVHHMGVPELVIQSSGMCRHATELCHAEAACGRLSSPYRARLPLNWHRQRFLAFS